MNGKSYTIVHTESSLGWGGQEIRILAEMEVLRRRGHRMLLAAAEESAIFKRATAANFEVFKLRPGRLAFAANVMRLARWFKAERVDIVNPHSSRDAWQAGFAGRLARSRFIVRSRHFEVPIASRWVSRFVYSSLADHLITTSPRIAEQFRSAFGFDDQRMSAIPTGVDLAQFSPEGPAEPFPAKAGQENWPLLGMVAVLRRAKGHVTLVQAVRKLRDAGFPARVAFVGEGPSKSPVEEEIKRLNLTDCVTFAGHSERVPAVLRALDMLVIPSLHEGIPQVALQALATKIPVVGSDVGGIPFVVKPGLTGRIFPAGDADATAIRETFADPAGTQAMREQGRRFVEEHHSLDRMADKIEDLYRNNLSSNGRNHSA